MKRKTESPLGTLDISRTMSMWVLFGWIVFITGLGYLVLNSENAYACTFGGCMPTSGGDGPPPPPPPDPPCESDSECCSKKGDPVSLYSGKWFYTYTDLVVNGVYPIKMVRKYDNQQRYDSPLGYGWAFTYDRRLYKYTDSSVIIRRNCGVRDKYTYTGNAYVSPIGSLATLTENADTSFTLTYLSGAQEFYDREGKLVALQDAKGNRLEMRYDTNGRLPLTGSSPYALDPNTPAIVAYDYKLTKIVERTADGNLTTNSVTINYDDSTGRITNIVASDGRMVSYQQDATISNKNGNLRTVNGLDGIISTFEYNDSGDAHNVTSIQVGQNSAPYVNTYDAQDRVITQTHRFNTLTFEYDTPTVLQTTVTNTIRNADGSSELHNAITVYEYNENGYPIKITDALGNETRTTYYSNMQVQRKEIWQKPDADSPLELLQATYYTYSTVGNREAEVVTLTSGEVITKTWTYEKNWVNSEQTISSIDPGKIFRTEYTFYYDKNANPINIKEKKERKDDGSFQITTYVYDSNGRLETTTLPDGHSITNVYTGAFLTKVYHDNGSGGESPFLKVEYDYDTKGNRNWIKDANGNITTMVYDDRGRIIQITNALNEETHYTYTDDKLTQIEVGRTAAEGPGQITKLTYTAEGWLESISRQDDGGSDLILLAYTYDSRGKPLSLTEAANDASGSTRTSLFDHDALGRLTKVTDPAGNETSYTYGALGNRTMVTDPKGNITRYDYDALSRLMQITQLDTTSNLVTLFTYDAVGNLTSVTDAKNQTTTYEYDALSNNTAVVQPLGQRVEYYYDDRNRLDYMINARKQKIDYEYEPWGPVKVVRYYADESTPTIDRTVSYTFNNNGFLTAAYDSAVQGYILYNIIPDALNRVSKVYQFGFAGGTQYQINAYDRYGNRNGVTTWRDGIQLNAFSYDYNKLNRLTAATLLAPTALNFTYNDNGSIRQITHANGIKSNYIYEINGPVKQIQLNGTGVLGQRDYVYDANRNVDTLTTLIGLHDYSYDGLNRLTQALHPTGSDLPAQEGFAYDDVGNREDIADDTLYQYDSNNRITNSPNTTWYLDDDGNTRLRYDGSLAETFVYNHENRLTKYLKGGNNTDYIYDPFGRRLKKTVNGVTTWFWWDGDKLLAEYDNSGNLIKRYAYLPGNYAPAQMADSSGNVYTVHSDHLDTPKQMTDSTGQVVWSAEHTAYGESTPNEDVDGDGTRVTLNVRFPGQYYDSETGLYYNYFRYYDPRTGRYITADPIGLRGGINLYSYVLNNPLYWSDPLGLYSGWAGVTSKFTGAAAAGAFIYGSRVPGIMLPAALIGLGLTGVTIGLDMYDNYQTGQGIRKNVQRVNDMKTEIEKNMEKIQETIDKNRIPFPPSNYNSPDRTDEKTKKEFCRQNPGAPNCNNSCP